MLLVAMLFRHAYTTDRSDNKDAEARREPQSVELYRLIVMELSSRGYHAVKICYEDKSSFISRTARRILVPPLQHASFLLRSSNSVQALCTVKR